MEYTPNDCLTTGIIDAVYQGQAALSQLFHELLSRNVLVTQPDTSAGVYTIPFADFINIIECNIGALTANGYTPDGMKPAINWRGELADLHRLDYSDVNRWFDSTGQIEAMVRGVAARLLITGTFASGTDRTRQLFSRGNM